MEPVSFLILTDQQHGRQQPGPTSSVFLRWPTRQRRGRTCSMGTQFISTRKVLPLKSCQTDRYDVWWYGDELFIDWTSTRSYHSRIPKRCSAGTALICCASHSVSAGMAQRPLLCCLPAILQTRATSTTRSIPPPRTDWLLMRVKAVMSSMTFIWKDKPLTASYQPVANPSASSFCTENLRKSSPNSEYAPYNFWTENIFKSFSAQREQTWWEKP